MKHGSVGRIRWASPRELELLRFIVGSHPPPTLAEMGRAMGWSSSSTTHEKLKILEAKGYIRRDPHLQRAITVLYDPDHPDACPACGQGFPPGVSGKSTNTMTDRTQQMVQARKAGSTLRSIGAAHNISRERVRKILARVGASVEYYTCEGCQVTVPSKTVGKYCATCL